MALAGGAAMTSALGFTASEPPAWNVQLFLHDDEAETALITLERNRLTFAWKCSEVDAVGMALRLGPSPVALGGLLKHACLGGADLLANRLQGRPSMAPFEALDVESDCDDWPWHTAADDTPEALRAPWNETVHRSRAALAEALATRGLDQQNLAGDEPAPAARGHDRGVRASQGAR